MNLTNESQTLFIPLLGKAEMSQANLFLHNPKAEEIIIFNNLYCSKISQSIYQIYEFKLKSNQLAKGNHHEKI